MAKPKGTISLAGVASASAAFSEGGEDDQTTQKSNETAESAESAENAGDSESVEEAGEVKDPGKVEGDQPNVVDSQETVSSVADPNGAKYTAPGPKRYASLRATQVRLYNSYQKVYFNTETASQLVEVDSWNQCQIDAGLLVEVSEQPVEQAKE